MDGILHVYGATVAAAAPAGARAGGERAEAVCVVLGAPAVRMMALQERRLAGTFEVLSTMKVWTRVNSSS